MAALYADENVSYTLIDDLVDLGHDIVSAKDDGKANQRIPDPDVLARAIDLGRVVLTNNRKHFHSLHRRHPSHLGIITFTADSDLDRLAARIDAELTRPTSLWGRLVKVIRPNETG